MIHTLNQLKSIIKKGPSTPATLIIGAHSGLGFDTALEIAKNGEPLIIASYNKEKIREAQAIIQFKSGNKSVFAIHLDFQDLDAIRQFCTTIVELNITIPLLINAIDFASLDIEVTKDGFEKTMAVNHLAPYLLVNQLQSQLIDHKSRIIFFSSQAHRHGKINFKRFASQKGIDTFGAYCNAKLANAAVIVHLAEQLQSRGICVNGFTPIPLPALWPFTFKALDHAHLYLRRYLVNQEESLDALLSLARGTRFESRDISGMLFCNYQSIKFAKAALSNKLKHSILKRTHSLIHFFSPGTEHQHPSKSNTPFISQRLSGAHKASTANHYTH